MLGRKLRYAEAPFFWSQHYDVPINYVGHAEGWDRTEASGSGSGRLVKYWQEGQLAAAATVHRDRDSLQLALDLEREA
jgi:hypothetical protein